MRTAKLFLAASTLLIVSSLPTHPESLRRDVGSDLHLLYADPRSITAEHAPTESALHSFDTNSQRDEERRALGYIEPEEANPGRPFMELRKRQNNLQETPTVSIGPPNPGAPRTSMPSSSKPTTAPTPSKSAESKRESTVATPTSLPPNVVLKTVVITPLPITNVIRITLHAATVTESLTPEVMSRLAMEYAKLKQPLAKPTLTTSEDADAEPTSTTTTITTKTAITSIAKLPAEKSSLKAPDPGKAPCPLVYVGTNAPAPTAS